MTGWKYGSLKDKIKVVVIRTVCEKINILHWIREVNKAGVGRNVVAGIKMIS